MNRNAVLAVVTAAGLALVAGLAWWMGAGDAARGAAAPLSAGGRLAVPAVDVEGLSGFDEREQVIIQQLRKKYGGMLAGVPLRLQVITHLRDLLRQLYPGDWQPRLLRILAAAFPALARELLDLFERLLRYEEWLQTLLPQLAFDSGAARQQAVWAKRVELFGEDAYAIWAHERREEQLRQTLQELSASTAPFGDKSRRYIEALRATYGDGIIGPDAPHRTQNLARFLGLEGVQKDLRAATPAERRRQLREFRAAMGLDAAALDRWEALDTERDSVRGAGERYLAERARLDALPPGPARDAELRALQDRLFGPAEAVFIRNEEASGVYRFKTPQTLGVN